MALDLQQYESYPTLDDNDYLKMFKSLLPRGLIWGFNYLIDNIIVQDVIASSEIWQDVIASGDVVQDSIEASDIDDFELFGRLLSCFSSECVRFESRFWTLVREAVPGLSSELLLDWENELALPEPEAVGLQTLEERQDAAHQKYYGEFSDTTDQYFIDYADNLGFTITIDNSSFISTPRIIGVARMGATQPRMGKGRKSNSVMEVTVTVGAGNLDVLKAKFQRIKQGHIAIVWIDAR